MTKKDFKASIEAGIRSHDTADKDRFEKVDSVLANLEAEAEKQRQAEEPMPSKTLVVRHTFSMSDSDYALVEMLRRTSAAHGPIPTASDICRIGLHAISGYSGEEVAAAIDKLERLRPGKRS
ncbi:hypothetical protein [Massilia soli]|uniref:Uncharacterized protein n=1 Tax=Massilia soli TaxID=2792854 RepID=A0ABS7SJZ6_9BURK|nr:hypothetical protein [Massilia soli]MBZ2206526.1 hypothetical protein [Massilia soli]